MSSQEVVGNMQEEIAKALLPITHYQVDLWTCEAAGRKVLATHAHWVDSAFRLRHALLLAVSEGVLIGVVFMLNLSFSFFYNALFAKKMNGNLKYNFPKGRWEA